MATGLRGQMGCCIPKDLGMRPALLLSGHTIALGVARALGEAGVPIFVASYSDHDMAPACRFVCGVTQVPNPVKCEAAFIQSVETCAQRLDQPVVIPADDATLVAASRHHERLSRSCLVACAPWPIVKRFINKDITYTLAGAAGVPVPQTFLPASLKDAQAAGNAIGYPCLLKPSRSDDFVDAFGSKFRLVHNTGELERAYVEAEQAGFRMMVQELIPGDDGQEVNYNALVINGQVRVEFTACKVRMAPPGGGVPCVVVSRHIPQVCHLGRTTLQAIGFNGYACTEFKLDARDATYRLFEVNGRHNRSTLLATRCGINFPLLHYEHLAYGRTPEPCGYREGVYWIDEFKDLQYFARRIRMAPSNVLRLWIPYLRPPVCAVMDWHDLKPFAIRLRLVARMACHQLCHATRLSRKPPKTNIPLSED